MPSSRSFGRLVKERRKVLDLTQKAIAEAVVCAVITIKRIEGETLRPSREIAERLAMVLKIPADERAGFVHLARASLQLTDSRTHRISPLTLEVRENADLSGHAIKGYDLRERIGSGGFGTVYRALQSGTNRSVAIKIILPEYANHPQFIRRFEPEVQIVARLEHPHIVPLYDYWRDLEGAYLVTDYIRGSSLQTALQSVRWPVERIARLLNQIGAALAFAHQLGVVHRDVKPSNILLDSHGNAYLTDFGIAKDLWMTEPNDRIQTGIIVGSPAYLSPEQLRDEPVTPQTDIYSLGIVLYELLASTHPFTDLSTAERIAMQLNEPLPALSTVRADLPSALDSIIRRATAKHPVERYPDIATLLSDWHLVATSEVQRLSRAKGMGDRVDMLDPLSTLDDRWFESVAQKATEAIKNPYKGLRAFREADANDFFGRNALVARLLERMAEARGTARFLAVLGPSGSGKSSVVHAGLIPTLRRGGLPNSDRWFIAEFRPGANPVDQLELALLKIATQPVDLHAHLDHDARGLVHVAKLILPDDGKSELLLVIDQFEELFTLVEDATKRAHFINNVVMAVSDTDSRVRVLITLRADFYDRPLLYSGFGQFMRDHTEVVLPVTPLELEQVIRSPAARAGVVVAASLVATIVRDVNQQPGALPLLQYALTELFERRTGNTLTLSDYQSSGTLLGALVRRADALYSALDQQGKEAVRQLFLRLVSLGEGGEDTRRRIHRSELAMADGIGIEHSSIVHRASSATNAVIDLYGRYRLLTFDHDQLTREPTVEVAHEALIRAWDRLRGWLDESRTDLRLHRQLASARSEWLQSGYDASFLASGARLSQFEALTANMNLVLNAHEQAYLAASISERSRREALEREYIQSLQVSLARSEAQRLAAEANALLHIHGNAELIALLSIRSICRYYSPQGDAALVGATLRDYPVQLYVGHAGSVYAAAFSPDDKYILTGSPDRTVILWNAQTNQQVRQFVGHIDAVEHVAFSPDGCTIVTSSDDKTARLWDVATCQQLHVLRGHTGIVYGVAFSPDGRYIVTASQDQTARLWDAQSGRELRRFIGHTDQVIGTAFSPDGNYLLTGSYDKTARLWDVATACEVRQFVGHNQIVWGVAFAPDGRSVLTASYDKSARLWDVQSGQVMMQFVGHNDAINGVAFAPDGKYVVTSSQDQTARLWDVQTGKELRQFVAHGSFVWHVAFSSDGETILTSSFDGIARKWHVQAKPYLPVLNDGSGVTAVAFSPDGKRILTGSFNNTARLWDAQTGTEVGTFIGHTGLVASVAFSPDGRYVLTSSVDHTVRLWDAQTTQKLHLFTGHTDIFHLNSIAFSPDGNRVITGNIDKTARLWDVQTGVQIYIFQQDYEVYAVAYSPDGKYVLIGTSEQTAQLWDAQSGAEVRVFNVPNERVAAVAFSPDGTQILTGSWNGVVRLWDVRTGAPLHLFVGHTDIVRSAVFSPNGKCVLTGSQDKTARLWDAQTGQELRRFTGHTATLQGVAFSHDGTYVLTGSLDGTARLWDVNYHDTIRYLCSRLLRDFTDDERVQYSIGDQASTCPQSKD